MIEVDGSTLHGASRHSPGAPAPGRDSGSTSGGDATGPDREHVRPSGCTDETVDAVGKVSEAFEWIERVRGRLFDFHQMMGRADFLFGDAADALEAAGHDSEAEMLRRDIVGRNVLEGRWTFQMIEEFDRCYYAPTRAVVDEIHASLVEGKRHVAEAELKERRRTNGRPGHESRPPASPPVAPGD
jgi:hypothetical protein